MITITMITKITILIIINIRKIFNTLNYINYITITINYIRRNKKNVNVQTPSILSATSPRKFKIRNKLRQTERKVKKWN